MANKSRMRFTKKALLALEPRDRRYWVHDEGLRGLSVAVQPSGRRLFYLYRWHRGKPVQLRLGEVGVMTVAEARSYLEEGQFAPGSMKPKIEAAVDFLETGGDRVIITQPHLLEAALAGETGTHIIP